MGRGRGAIVLAVVFGLMLASAGAAPAAGWLPQANVSPLDSQASQYDVSAQDVAMDGEGNAVAVWVRGADDGPEPVEAATRPAGGAWGSPVTVSDASENALDVQVVANAAGDVAAVWVGIEAGNKLALRAATRPAGGGWSEPAELSPLDAYAREPAAAIDAEGNLTVAWNESEGGWALGVVMTASLPAGGEWSEAVELSDGEALSPQLAADPEGNVTAVWTLLDEDRDDGVIQAKARPAEGEWGTAVDVSGAGGLASRPRLAVDAQGDATVVWSRRDIPNANGYLEFVQAAQRLDGTWDEPQTLSKTDGLAGEANVAVDAAGRATAIWLYFGAARLVQARSADAGGSWGETVTLTSKSGMLEPSEGDFQLVADPQGGVTALWSAWSAPNLVVRSAHRPAGGTWSSAANLSANGAYALWPRLAVDPQGVVTAVWSGYQGGTHAVRSRVFDPVGPELRDLAVPASAVAGEPVAMSVAPFDLWSPVTTSWSFGDGSSAAGTAVEHCFGSPGERTVMVTGTDTAGNATSAERTIEVAANPAFPAGANACDPPGPGPDPAPDPGPRPGPGADSAQSFPPSVLTLRQTHPRWRTGAAGKSRLPVGTSFWVRLNRSASVQLAFAQSVRGRYQPRGALRKQGVAGGNTYRFAGKLGGRTLKPGRYRLTVTAAVDGEPPSSRSIRFTIAG